MAERKKKPAAKKPAATTRSSRKKRAAKKKAVAKKKPAAKRTRSTKPAAKKPVAKAKPAPKPPAKLTGEAVRLEVETPEVPKPPPGPKQPQLPALKTALEWIGMQVDGSDKNLGKLVGLHVDVVDGKPRWAVVRLGRVAGCTALPYDHVAEGGDRLFAAYEKGWVKEAPRFKPDAALTADQELELCAHWGIRMDKGRSFEVRGRKPDEISAVPAEPS